MRGTQCHGYEATLYGGITPAYAGNTCVACMPVVAYKDHPRVCGEHQQRPSPAEGGIGSPPRMRGTLHVRRVLFAVDGITPAYAGNTLISGFAGRAVWDHPRVCGEHMLRLAGTAEHEGSPPRMRGTPDYDAQADIDAGITPAYAGNTVAAFAAARSL